jgi:hypothetical protein
VVRVPGYRSRALGFDSRQEGSNGEIRKNGRKKNKQEQKHKSNEEDMKG